MERFTKNKDTFPEDVENLVSVCYYPRVIAIIIVEYSYDKVVFEFDGDSNRISESVTGSESYILGVIRMVNEFEENKYSFVSTSTDVPGLVNQNYNGRILTIKNWNRSDDKGAIKTRFSHLDKSPDIYYLYLPFNRSFIMVIRDLRILDGMCWMLRNIRWNYVIINRGVVFKNKVHE